ncbi:pseudouridine synthase [Marinicella sp. W31]|uniref:pseudouridine synthase n=1 Tax=Marinicella sp. W31 TaxID=3023713 RepID=UPI0037574869
MTKLIVFNKPYHVLSQFSPEGDKTTLAKYIDEPEVYPAGRLDYDSEGLLLLTDDGVLQHRISHPQGKMVKTYLVQVEGIVKKNAIQRLLKGVKIQDYMASALAIRPLAGKPGYLWKRVPPIRQRKKSPTCWLEVDLNQGKNRQVKRMLAAVGHPVLRLVRIQVGSWTLNDIKPGEYKILDAKKIKKNSL